MRVDTGNETMEEREDEKNAEMIDKAKAGEKGIQTEDGTMTAMTRVPGTETRDVMKIEEGTSMVVTETDEEGMAAGDVTKTTIHRPHRTRRTLGKTPQCRIKKDNADRGGENDEETNEHAIFTKCGKNLRNNERKERTDINSAGSSSDETNIVLEHRNRKYDKHNVPSKGTLQSWRQDWIQFQFRPF